MLYLDFEIVCIGISKAYGEELCVMANGKSEQVTVRSVEYFWFSILGGLVVLSCLE